MNTLSTQEVPSPTPLNGRRALRAELEARCRYRTFDVYSATLYVGMAPRRTRKGPDGKKVLGRRERQGKSFIPVYGYRGPGCTPPRREGQPMPENLAEVTELEEERSEQEFSDL